MTKKNITQQSKQLQQDWETNPRWKNAKRTYSAERDWSGYICSDVLASAAICQPER